MIRLTPNDAARLLAEAYLRSLGGPGSGNFGHAGRPGEVGGSAPTEFPKDLKKIGSAKGTNPGGTYVDGSGKKWYVKQYSNSDQAANENVANAIYRAIGVPVPASALSEDGKQIALRWEDSKGTLGQVGVTKDVARKILDGFAGDVFLQNWDAVGTGHDNVIVKESGTPLRVDQGGTLLFRAQGAPKPESTLDKIDEWDSLREKNVYYNAVFQAAGVKNADDLGERVISQIDRIVQARPAAGWESVVREYAPKATETFKKRVGVMLEARQKLLEKKREELIKRFRAAGGPGSGNFGHAGRPGEVGGSAPQIFKSDVGSLEITRRGDHYVVQEAHVQPEHQGKGEGVKLYKQALAFAEKQGLDLHSSHAVSISADRVWQSLKRQGVPVTRAEDVELDESLQKYYAVKDLQIGSQILKVRSGEPIWRTSLKTLGGPGSGNFGHAGRPGEIGGSAPSIEGRLKQFETDNPFYGDSPLPAAKKDESFTEEELQQIREYQNGVGVNNLLRDANNPEAFEFQRSYAQESLKTPLYAKQIAALDTATSKSVLEEATTLYRGVHPGLAKFPEVGEEFTEHGFIATSLDPEIAKGFGALTVEIQLEKNDLALDVNKALGTKSRYEQKELLLPRGQRFKVVAKTPEKVTVVPVRKLRTAGGPGSGNFGHAGRPGEVGGSAPSGSGSVEQKKADIAEAITHQPFVESINPVSDALAAGYKLKYEKDGVFDANHMTWYDQSGNKIAEGTQYESTARSIRVPRPAFEEPLSNLKPEGWPISDDVERGLDAVYEKTIEKQSEAWGQSLSGEEKQAFSSYTGGMYSKINNHMRGKTKGEPHEIVVETANHIQDALKRAPTAPPPDLVWRGVLGNTAQVYAKLNTGDVIEMGGFQSTSIDPFKALEWGHTLLEIKPVRGAFIKSLSQSSAENEYMLEHGAKYTVRGVTAIKIKGTTQRKRVIQLEMHSK